MRRYQCDKKISVLQSIKRKVFTQAIARFCSVMATNGIKDAEVSLFTDGSLKSMSPICNCNAPEWLIKASNPKYV
jgi:hypothetical protein